jgi:hypothetical protein
MTKFRTSLIILCIGLSAGCSGPAAATNRVWRIQPEREVLTVAEEARFDYMGILRRAEMGEADALVALINFSPQTDAAASLAHGWVLLDLRKMIGNGKFASALARATNVGRKSALGSMETAARYE